MFVWRKRARTVWLAANESKLREIAGEQLAIIEEANRKNAIAEIAGTSRRALERIRSRFGGRIEQLPRDWLKKLFSLARKLKPLRIGKRLVIARNGGFQTAVGFESAAGKPPLLVIPAGMAFGTGEHATTAMSLRLLEQLTRGWGAQATSRNVRKTFGTSASCRRLQAGSLRSPERDFAMLDLGTGSGILALAAKRFGAGKVMAIDLDPIAVSTAENINNLLQTRFVL